MRAFVAAAFLAGTLAACLPARGPSPAGPPAACDAAFELAARDASRGDDPPTLFLEGHGACRDASERAAGRLQADGLDAWPWSDAFGDVRPRCPSPTCGPPGGAARVTVDVWALPAKCEALEHAREDDEDAQGTVDVFPRRGRRLATPCTSESSCERARLRVLRHGGGHSHTVFLLCKEGHYVAYDDHGDAFVF